MLDAPQYAVQATQQLADTLQAKRPRVKECHGHKRRVTRCTVTIKGTKQTVYLSVDLKSDGDYVLATVHIRKVHDTV